MSRPSEVQIDYDALRHNLNRVKKIAAHSAVLAMVKANAYGHGLKQTALALSEADGFGVACLEEALSLRAIPIQKSIVLMEGFFSPHELFQISECEFETVIHHEYQLKCLENCSLSKPIKIWLKIDTGMHRLGFLPSEVNRVYQRLRHCRSVKKDVCFISHFADADNPSKPMTEQQIKCFNETTADLVGQRSLANSAAILAWPITHVEWVRPGLMLYGVSPFANKMAAEYDLKPVMTLRSALIAVHTLRKGDAVGYSGAWVCPENMPVGIVAIGYGDGYPRHAKNGTPVLVNEKIVPLIGRVAMDMLAVDLREHSRAKIGDPVVLWGEGLPIEWVANHADTIPYELLCGVTERIRRVN